MRRVVCWLVGHEWHHLRGQTGALRHLDLDQCLRCCSLRPHWQPLVIGRQ